VIVLYRLHIGISYFLISATYIVGLPSDISRRPIVFNHGLSHIHFGMGQVMWVGE
jgi:hypothetical protein